MYQDSEKNKRDDLKLDRAIGNTKSSLEKSTEKICRKKYETTRRKVGKVRENNPFSRNILLKQ